jgi:uncharacterized membrane protein YeaQ/YmgE (transglycosylase-associated protein family)
MICTLLGWAVFGIFVGAIARLVWPGRHPMGLVATMLLGVAGSVVGGLVTLALRGGPQPYEPAGYLMSILGAIVVLWISGSTARRAD